MVLCDWTMAERFKCLNTEHSFIRYKCWQTRHKLQLQLTIFFSFPVTDTALERKTEMSTFTCKWSSFYLTAAQCTSNGLCIRIEIERTRFSSKHGTCYMLRNLIFSMNIKKKKKIVSFQMLLVCQFRMYMEGTIAFWWTKARISSELIVSGFKKKTYEIIPGLFVRNHMNLSEIIVPNSYRSIYWFQSIPMHIRLIILTHFSTKNQIHCTVRNLQLSIMKIQKRILVHTTNIQHNTE